MTIEEGLAIEIAHCQQLTFQNLFFFSFERALKIPADDLPTPLQTLRLHFMPNPSPSLTIQKLNRLKLQFEALQDYAAFYTYQERRYVRKNLPEAIGGIYGRAFWNEKYQEEFRAQQKAAVRSEGIEPEENEWSELIESLEREVGTLQNELERYQNYFRKQESLYVAQQEEKSQRASSPRRTEFQLEKRAEYRRLEGLNPDRGLPSPAGASAPKQNHSSRLP